MSGKRILISPMNWGFGHAGRMIPLALELKRRGNEIIFAAHKDLIPLLVNELPGIRLMSIPDMNIRYSRYIPQYWSIFIQIPLVILSALREHFLLKKLVRDLQPDVIISDNRLGFWHHSVYSVYVTHQLRLRLPLAFKFLEPLGSRLHRMIINNYDLCLVPDLPGKENLSGRLSHDTILPGNALYIGPLSRFRAVEPSEVKMDLDQPYYCLILSGPEPQRSLLFRKVASSLKGRRLVVLGGTAVTGAGQTDPDIIFIKNPDTKTMRQVITGSTMVITRSGYTSIMELVSLGKGAVLIPTPGQTEQEYLGPYLDGRYGFLSLSQKEIKRLSSLIERQSPETVQTFPDSRNIFNEAVDLLTEKKTESGCH